MKTKDVKEVISEKLEERGMSFVKLAEKTGIPYKNKIIKVFGKNQNRNLRAEELVLICAVLELSLNDFLEE